MEDLIPLKQAARLVNLSTRTLRRYIKRGKVRSVRKSGMLFVPYADLETIKNGEVVTPADNLIGQLVDNESIIIRREEHKSMLDQIGYLRAQVDHTRQLLTQGDSTRRTAEQECEIAHYNLKIKLQELIELLEGGDVSDEAYDLVFSCTGPCGVCQKACPEGLAPQTALFSASAKIADAGKPHRI